MPKEPRLRSLLKAITWRLIATSTTFILAYFIFRDTGCDNVLEKSSMVAGLELIIKLAIYYVHERLWLLAPLENLVEEPPPVGMGKKGKPILEHDE